MSTHKAAPKEQHESDRYAELKKILEDRRREMMSQVQERMRDVRTEGAGSTVQGVLDAAESSEADIQDEIEFALIQMKAETLSKIDEALRRLEEGTYGYCFECGEEVSERRLRALPVRRPLQGLRGSPRGRPAARAPDGAAPGRRLALHRHAGLIAVRHPDGWVIGSSIDGLIAHPHLVHSADSLPGYTARHRRIANERSERGSPRDAARGRL